MSKVGKNPITIPEGITIEIGEKNIIVKGKNGEMKPLLLRGVKPVLTDGTLTFELTGKSKQSRSNWGTTRALVANAVRGLTVGFEKTLILEGVGFRITKEGENLNLSLGFSHPVKYQKPDTISFEVEKNTILKIRGFNKELVGQVAAEIRAFKKPEPYKGKGFHYSNEIIQRKVGKKAAKAGA